jgi:hypothetical protein
VLLVPHWQRAVTFYQKIRELPNGVSAIPEYGEQQIFRYGKWYHKAFEDAGFEIGIHKDILIPDDQRLCERYRKSIGEPIFLLLVAHASNGQDSCAPRAKAFDIAHDNRNFAIEMLWKRSVFYWGFPADHASEHRKPKAGKMSDALPIAFSVATNPTNDAAISQGKQVLARILGE